MHHACIAVKAQRRRTAPDAQTRRTVTSVSGRTRPLTQGHAFASGLARRKTGPNAGSIGRQRVAVTLAGTGVGGRPIALLEPHEHFNPTRLHLCNHCSFVGAEGGG
jgi:hypothetical protein